VLSSEEVLMPRTIYEQVTVKLTNEELELYAWVAREFGRSIPDTIARLAMASVKQLLKDME
jgi:hypothetical protein